MYKAFMEGPLKTEEQLCVITHTASLQVQL